MKWLWGNAVPKIYINEWPEIIRQWVSVSFQVYGLRTGLDIELNVGLEKD